MSSALAQANFKTIPLSDLLARDFKTNWLIKGTIERENLVLFFGDSASGKSFLVQDACFCVAAGIAFKGRSTQKGNVLYICGEGFAGLKNRFTALHQHYQTLPEGLHLSEVPAAFMDKASTERVMKRVKEIGDISLIVIDTFHRNLGGGNEDSAADIATFLSNIDTYLKPIGAAIVIIHHSGHGNKERSRGSSSLQAAMDVCFQIKRDKNDIVTVTNTKMKDHAPPLPESYRMNIVDLLSNDSLSLTDEDGEKITSVILEPTNTALKGNIKLNPNDETVLSCLSEALKFNGKEPLPAITDFCTNSQLNIPLKVASLEQWRLLACGRITVNSKPDATDKTKAHALNTAFKRSCEKLENLGFVKSDSGFVWLAKN